MHFSKRGKEKYHSKPGENFYSLHLASINNHLTVPLFMIKVQMKQFNSVSWIRIA